MRRAMPLILLLGCANTVDPDQTILSTPVEWSPTPTPLPVETPEPVAADPLDECPDNPDLIVPIDYLMEVWQ